MFWIGLLAHEGAHYGLLSILSRAGTLSQALAYLPAAAGPLTTLTIVVVTTVLSVRARNETAQRVMFVTALTAASRLVLTAVPTMLGRVNDEQTVGVLTGVPPVMIWSAEALLTGALILWMVRRLPQHRSLIGAAAFASLAGWVSAFTFGRAVGLPI